MASGVAAGPALFLWLLLAQAQPPAAAPSHRSAPETPAQWRAAAREDIEAGYAMFRQRHPGMRDPRNPGFPAQLRAAREAGLRELPRVADSLGHRRALLLFSTALRDGHAGMVLPPLGLTGSIWPGFTTVWRHDRLLVDQSLPEGPPRGAEVVQCDGLPTRRALERDVFSRGWRPAEAGQWWVAAPHLFIRSPVLADRPRRCAFRAPGGRTIVRDLAWTPLPRAAFERQIADNYGERNPIGLTEPRPGIHVISLPSFEPDADGQAAFERLYAALEADRAKLAAARAILIDLRHNGGGSSHWGERVAELLWGEDAVQAAKAAYFRRTEVWWLTRPENVARVRGFATDARRRGDAGAADRIEARAAGMAAAAARGEPFFVQRFGEGLAANAAATPARRLPPVYILTHGGCASACLDAIDIFRLFPGVRQVGAPTSGDSNYMEITIAALPSGRASLVIPNKIWVNRPRASGAVYTPDILVTDLIWSNDLFLDRIERDLAR
jgi:hypothetical protein